MAAYQSLQHLLWRRPLGAMILRTAAARRLSPSSAFASLSSFSAVSPRAVPPTAFSASRRGLSDGFGVRASQVNDPGAIDSPLMKSMERKIKEQLNADSVVVKDAYGDGRHVSIEVVAASFEGQSAVNRQRMVYKAIWEELQSTVHAVDQMTTRTPDEVKK